MSHPEQEGVEVHLICTLEQHVASQVVDVLVQAVVLCVRAIVIDHSCRAHTQRSGCRK